MNLQTQNYNFSPKDSSLGLGCSRNRKKMGLLRPTWSVLGLKTGCSWNQRADVVV